MYTLGAGTAVCKAAFMVQQPAARCPAAAAAAAAPLAPSRRSLPHNALGSRQRRSSSSLVAAAVGAGDSAAYSFAQSGPERRPGERRNRAIDKRAAAEVSSIVKGLVAMTPKQLAAVRHLLTDEQVAELGLAVRLPRNNQGRKRHENRVAQLIRDGTSDAAVGKLADAVQLAQASSALFVDPDAASLVDSWLRRLRSGDDAALEEVVGLLDGALDMQQLRRLAQQLAGASSSSDSSGGTATAAGGGGAGGGDGSGSGAGSASEGSEAGELQVAEAVLGDPELLALITARGKKRGGNSGGGGGGGGKGKGGSGAAAAEKQLRQLLQPVALRLIGLDATG